MKLETVMRKLQEADLTLATIEVLEEYAFAIDLNDALKKIGHYSVMYYTRCEDAGLTYKEATDKLGAFLSKNLGYVKKEESEQS